MSVHSKLCVCVCVLGVYIQCGCVVVCHSIVCVIIQLCMCGCVHSYELRKMCVCMGCVWFLGVGVLVIGSTRCVGLG